MRQVIFLLLIGLAMPSIVAAQQASDIIRYTQNELTGTARTLGVSNSNGALGGDYGAIKMNPASLGIYRKSEFIFSPGFYKMNSDSYVENAENSIFEEGSASQLAIDNIGMVFASKLNRNSNNTFNVAVGLNRVAKFNRDFEYSGETLGSIGTHFADLASGSNPSELDNFGTGLAYDTYIIGIEENGLDYFSDFTNEDLVNKSGSFRSEGGVYELDLAFASNIDQKLSLGVKLGVPIVSYEEEILYTETDDRGISPYFNRVEYDQYLNTTGTGFNASFGVIYAPVFPFRLGLSLQSPTWYSMNDDFDTRMFFDYVDDPDVFPAAPPQEALSPDGRFSYDLKTPWRVKAQSGLLLGKKGFVSAEVEYLDYGNASFSYENGFEQAERAVNMNIRNQFDEVINVKVGGELALGVFRGRAGAGFYQSPLINDNSFTPSYTVGTGFYEDQFFVDLTYRWSQDDFIYSPYQRVNSEDPQPRVDVDQSIHHVLLTVGFRL